MKLKFVHILGLSAAILTCTAAYISVTGLSKLFIGAFYSMIVMISGLELAKLVIASYLYRYWSETSKLFKGYLVIGVIVIMIITSAGIYGFLSSAYSVTAGKMTQVDRQIEFFEKKKSVIQDQVTRVKSIIDNKSSRINALTAIRISQEARIDTLYKKNYIASVRKTETIIRDANNEIGRLSHQIDSLGSSTQILLDSISRIDLKVLEYKESDLTSEIGPLKYVAILTGKSIDSVVNFFIFILIFVFDPLAVCLVIATNKVLLRDKEPEEMKVVIPGSTTEKLDLILNNYLEVCKAASVSDATFQEFKSIPAYRQVLEHLTKGIGEKHLELIERNNPWLLFVEKIWENDKYGAPHLEEFETKLGRKIVCSPTTLQYLSVVSNLHDTFKSLEDWKIVEIGGGYGGQCKIIQDIWKIKEYNLIDLEEAGDLQGKYLEKLDCIDKVNIYNNIDYKETIDGDFDLVISNYALTELTEGDQRDYVENICLNSKHGYLTCNSQLIGIELIRQKFRDTFKISPDIEGERKTNYLITW